MSAFLGPDAFNLKIKNKRNNDRITESDKTVLNCWSVYNSPMVFVEIGCIVPTVSPAMMG